MSCDTPSKQELEEIFNYYDKDGSGKIDVAEIRSAVQEYYTKVGKTPSEKDLDDAVEGILAVSDSSGDGKIDKKEWLKYFEVN